MWGREHAYAATAVPLLLLSPITQSACCSMSFCKDFGKDKVIFVTKEDHETEPRYELPADEEPRGLILPNGDINWSCPCIGGTASGPCASEFREAFSCFHYSKSETKGSECVDKFSALNNCMSEFPALYKRESELDMEPESFDTDRLDEELRTLEEKRIREKAQAEQAATTTVSE